MNKWFNYRYKFILGLRVIHIYFTENLNECESNPCRNNGTCVGGWNGYNCTCADGFEGNHCEGGNIQICKTQITLSVKVRFAVNIKCLSDPCQNRGTCIDDAVNGYTCLCAQGYSGNNCKGSYKKKILKNNKIDLISNDCFRNHCWVFEQPLPKQPILYWW